MNTNEQSSPHATPIERHRLLRNLIILVASNIFIRVLLISWHPAEYTDGVVMMNLAAIGTNKWLPFYPALLHGLDLLVHDVEVSGRLIAVLAASLGVIPVYFLVVRITSERHAITAAVLYSTSPLVIRWSLHVMTETTFLAIFLGAVWACVDHMESTDDTKSLTLATVLSALASLTRPEGLVLLPVVLFLHLRLIHRVGLRVAFSTHLSLLVWLGVGAWHGVMTRSFLYGEEMASSTRSVDRVHVFTYLTSYAEAFVYVLGYALAIFVFLGIVELCRRKAFALVALCVYFALAWGAVLSVHWAWTTRLLFPLVGLAMVLAGYGLQSTERHLGAPRTSLVSVALVIVNVVFSCVVLTSQRDSFADIKKASLHLRSFESEAVYSDEITKTEFYSQRPARKYSRDTIPADAVVVLHSFYSDIERETRYLHIDNDVQLLYRATSRVRPILADDLLERVGNSQPTNSPLSMSLRFEPQDFETVILRVRNRSTH